MQLKAAVVQVTATPDREHNLARAEALVRAAHSGSRAQLIALPEVFAWKGPPGSESGVACAIPGPLTRRLGKLARDLSVHLLAGSVLERGPDPRAYNTSVLFGPTGRIVARYRKMHLFDVHVPGHGPVRESATRAPGDRAVVATLPGGLRLGMSICYDLRFPELYRRLVREGAQVLAVPAAFTERTGRDHWLALLRARAIENLAFVIAPNQWGRGGDGIESYGRSVIIDPWGTVLACCPDGESWASAVLDLDGQTEVRARFPALTHMRGELFESGPPVEKKRLGGRRIRP